MSSQHQKAERGKRLAPKVDELRYAAAMIRDQNTPGRGYIDDTLLSVADWLSTSADHADGRGAWCDSCLDKALDVARTYLGRAS